MSTFADANTANPFYRDPNDFIDDSGIERPPALKFGDMGTIDANTFKGKTYGGTIQHDKTKKLKKGSVVPDCFKTDTVGVHVNKGGDGFEAWKGNRKVIKKLKIGKIVEYQTTIPREGKYSQPIQRGT